MLKSIIEAVGHCFRSYKSVKTFRYQNESLNNAQNNYEGFQVYVDDVSRHQLNITDGTFTAEFQIMVLKHVDDGDTVLSVQDDAYTLACSVVEMLDRNPQYYGVMRVHDYSLLTCSHATDDDASGVMLTLVLEVPNPAELCDDTIWIEPPVEPDEKLELHPITLPKRPLC